MVEVGYNAAYLRVHCPHLGIATSSSKVLRRQNHKVRLMGKMADLVGGNAIRMNLLLGPLRTVHAGGHTLKLLLPTDRILAVGQGNTAFGVPQEVAPLE